MRSFTQQLVEQQAQLLQGEPSAWLAFVHCEVRFEDIRELAVQLRSTLGISIYLEFVACNFTDGASIGLEQLLRKDNGRPRSQIRGLNLIICGTKGHPDLALVLAPRTSLVSLFLTFVGPTALTLQSLSGLSQGIRGSSLLNLRVMVRKSSLPSGDLLAHLSNLILQASRSSASLSLVLSCMPQLFDNVHNAKRFFLACKGIPNGFGLALRNVGLNDDSASAILHALLDPCRKLNKLNFLHLSGRGFTGMKFYPQLLLSLRAVGTLSNNLTVVDKASSLSIDNEKTIEIFRSLSANHLRLPHLKLVFGKTRFAKHRKKDRKHFASVQAFIAQRSLRMEKAQEMIHMAHRIPKSLWPNIFSALGDSESGGEAVHFLLSHQHTKIM